MVQQAEQWRCSLRSKWERSSQAAPRLGRAGRPRSRVGTPPITLAIQVDARRVSRPQLVPMRQSRPVSSSFVALRGKLFFCGFRHAAAIQKYKSSPTRALTPLVSSDKGTVTPTSVKGMVLEALP